MHVSIRSGIPAYTVLSLLRDLPSYRLSGMFLESGSSFKKVFNLGVQFSVKPLQVCSLVLLEIVLDEESTTVIKPIIISRQSLSIDCDPVSTLIPRRRNVWRLEDLPWQLPLRRLCL